VLQGHDSGGEKECGRRRSNAPERRFSLLFVRGSLWLDRAERGLALRRCRRLCARYGFHRDGGCGDLNIGGGRISGPALPISLGAGSVLRCAFRRVHPAQVKARKRACAGEHRSRKGGAIPKGMNVTSLGKAEPGSQCSGLDHSRARVLRYCLGGRRAPPRENDRSYYAV